MRRNRKSEVCTKASPFETMKEELDNICEECKKDDKSVTQNLIKHGYKICNSCKIIKTIFPF